MQSDRDCDDLLKLGPRARCILDAARTCFERYGFHAASMSRIAEEAGISVGHIYRYFANKEAVVAAIIGQDLDEVSGDIESLAGSPGDIADHILKSFERSRSRQRTVLRLEVLAEGARNPKVAAMIGGMERRVRGRVKSALSNSLEGQPCGFKIDDAELELRTSLIGLLMEGLQIRAFEEGEALPKHLVTHVRGILMQIFSPAPIKTDAAVSYLSLRRG